MSIGMFEHVGPRHYGTFFDVARRCLAPGGLFLLHTIGNQKSFAYGDPWGMPENIGRVLLLNYAEDHLDPWRAAAASSTTTR